MRPETNRRILPKAGGKSGLRSEIAADQAFELVARRDLEFERLHELRIVALQDPEEIGDLAIQVVYHLGFGLLRASQEHAAHANERFGIARVRRGIDAGDDDFGEDALAADKGGRRLNGLDRFGCGGFWHLNERLLAKGLFASAPDQVIANEYLPGQGISAHVDCVPCFDDTIVSLSLLSRCEMVFRERLSGGKLSVILEPCSAVVMTGAARYEWTHEIPARKSDGIDGMKVLRARRISLTFRKVARTVE